MGKFFKNAFFKGKHKTVFSPFKKNFDQLWKLTQKATEWEKKNPGKKYKNTYIRTKPARNKIKKDLKQIVGILDRTLKKLGI